MYQKNIYNIGDSERLMRVVLGVGLIVDVLHGSGPLGLAALIPLASIYPIMTGFLGFDPIYAAIGYSSIKSARTGKIASRKTRTSRDSVNNIGNTERIMRVTLGVGLMVDVMLGVGTLGMAVLIPLASIYPLMTGFLGYDPIYQAIGYSSIKSGQKGKAPVRKPAFASRTITRDSVHNMP